jgi:NDP-sugar pyrophosphorylase family protein
MIEKEIFPAMAQEGKLFCQSLPNDFWFDIGKPGDYLLGQGAYLNYYKIKSSNEYIGHVLVDSSSVV